MKRPQIEVSSFDPAQAEEWDGFVARDSRNGGLFHERRFLSYHGSERFRDASLVFRDQAGGLVGVLPCAEVDLEHGGRAAESHPGSSAGSFVFSRHARTSQMLEVVDAAARYFGNKSFVRLGLRVAEPIFAATPVGELDFALWHRGFRLRTRELSTAIRLGDETMRLVLARKKAVVDERAARRRGIEIKESQEVEAVWRTVADNLQQRYGKKPAHTLAELALLKQLYPDRIRFWCATRHDEIIAAMVVFEVTERAAHTFYIAHDRTHADVNPMPLLISEICTDLTARGFGWLNFGISTRGDFVKWGILEFKEFMGGRGVCREEWELADLHNFQPYQWDEADGRHEAASDERSE
jgi:GNAT acetyltransferase-like protein